MPSTMSLRVGDELLESAKVAAELAGRSAAQQIGYWAKLGRELERSGSVSVREVAEVLAGARAYDDLDGKAQAVVRAEWAERTEARRAGLNLTEEFAAEGRSWVELGPGGTTVRRSAKGEEPVTTKKSSSPATRKKAGKPTAKPSGRKQATAKRSGGRQAGAKKPVTRKAAGRTR